MRPCSAASPSWAPFVGTRQDLSEVFALHAAGRTHVIAEPWRLDQVDDSFDEVSADRPRRKSVA
jgi:propanol-preferring alcohol dehydrogenase